MQDSRGSADSGGHAAMTPSHAEEGVTIGGELERRRPEHRAAQLRRVLAALGDQATHRSQNGEAPAPLRAAVAAFSAELRTLERRLAVRSSRRR